MFNKFNLIVLFVGLTFATYVCGQSISPQIGGGISQFDGGISRTLVPSWVPNRANLPDIAFNFTTNSSWIKATKAQNTASSLLTVSRASSGTVNDSLGNWTQVASNLPRMSNLGLLVEEARTNSIRNNSMVGAVVMADNVELLTNGNFAGGSGITAPGWTVNVGSGAINFTGSSFQITGDGTTNNTYIAQQISGLVVGRNYVIVVAGSGTVQASVGSSPGNGSVLGPSSLTGNGNASNNTDRAAFTATATTHWVTFSKLGAVLTTMTSFSVQDGERVENGGFTSNPINAAQSTVQNGWQYSLNAGTGTAAYVGGNSVTLTDDGTHAVWFGQLIPTVSGFTYTISVDVSGNAGKVLVGPSTGGLGASSLLNTATSVGTGQKFQFTATSASTFLTFSKSAGGSTAMTIANVSVQSAGALPTNWIGVNNIFGITWQVVGKGTESGIDYIDYRVFGTTTGTLSGQVYLFSEGQQQVAASYGQTWTASQFIYLVGGSYTNMTFVGSGGIENNSSGSGIHSHIANFSNSTGPLGSNRIASSWTSTDSLNAFNNIRLLQFNAASGVAIDATFRIGWPQLENNSLINSTVASAAIAAGGTGGVSGTAVYSVGGGTGTGATLNVTVSGGAITAINSVASAGSYSVFPPSPAALTYVSGTGSGVTGATVNLTPTSNAANAFATSPIVTTSSAATRAADVVTMTSPPAFGAAYTLYSQSNMASITGFYSQLAVDDGTISNASVLRSNNGDIGARVILAGVNKYTPLGTSSYTPLTTFKAAMAVADSDQDYAYNGSLKAAGTGTPVPSVGTRVSIGNWGGGFNNGFLSQAALWASQRVPNAQLQSMTQ